MRSGWTGNRTECWPPATPQRGENGIPLGAVWPEPAIGGSRCDRPAHVANNAEDRNGLDSGGRLFKGTGFETDRLAHGRRDLCNRRGDRWRVRNRLLKATVASIALLAILTGVAVAQGAVSDKLRTGNTVTVAAGETVSNDLYAFAGTVRIDGTVDGDLVASGGLVDVTGTVTG